MFGDRVGRPRRQAEARNYYLALRPPPEVAETLHRQALLLLRPELSTIWLDTEAGPGGWPDQHLDTWNRARELATAQAADGSARRPGTGPSTVALQAGDDEQFAIAAELAPMSNSVEAMSRHGQLLLTRRVGTGSLLLRLTTDQHRALTDRAPRETAWLVRTERPGTELDRMSRGWWLPAWILAGLVGGPLILVVVLGPLLTRPWPGAVLHWGPYGLAGCWLIVRGMSVARYAIRRAIRQRGVPRRPSITHPVYDCSDGS